jgi:hypothetical protein
LALINDAKTFESVWKAFKPGEAVPEIDFTTSDELIMLSE